MGILNVMPASFSDGGQYFDRDRAIARGKEMEGAEDEGSSYFATNLSDRAPADVTNIRAERGPSSFDIRHWVVTSYVIDLPVGPGRFEQSSR